MASSRWIFTGLALAIFSVLSGASRFWDDTGPHLLPAGSIGLVLAALLIAAGLWRLRLERESNPDGALCLALGLTLIFFCDWLTRGYNFFQGPSIRGEIILLGALFVLVPSQWRKGIILGAALGTPVILYICFALETDGRMLFSDDHASFFYRMSLLKENFPNIPFYYPLWNGGLDARDFFATGALNFFLVLSPVIYAFDLAENYNLLVALIVFGLLPLSIFLAGKLEGLSKTGAAVSAILSLTSGLIWYRWSLKYGTMGFCTAACLVPLNLVLVRRFVDPRQNFTPALALLFVLSVSLMLLWTGSGLVFIPAILAFLIKARSLIAKPERIACVLALLLVNLPWIAAFWSVSSVSQFVQSEPAPRESASLEASRTSPPATHIQQRRAAFNLKKSLRIAREHAISTNPFLLFLGIAGILLLARPSRNLYLATSLWLIILGALLSPIKPQLELDRMLLLLVLFWCIPAGLAFDRLCQSGARIPLLRYNLFLSSGFLLAGIFCSAAVLGNRSVEHYHTKNDLVDNLSEAIRQHGGGGRVLFSGFILHELSNGHVAPLTVYTGKPLVASSPFHSMWKYTQVFPHSYLSRGDVGIKEYLDAMNITAVIAHEQEWRDYFAARNSQYELVFQQENFSLFRRLDYQSNYFSTGSGAILEQDKNRLVLKVNSSENVIKFRYFPFLESSSCLLEKEAFAPELPLIKLTGCEPGSTVEVKSKPVWQRVWESLK